MASVGDRVRAMEMLKMEMSVRGRAEKAAMTAAAVVSCQAVKRREQVTEMQAPATVQQGSSLAGGRVCR